MAELEFKNVGKRYGKGPEVLRDVNLTIAQGEFCVFIGPSGCGKSTLLRMVAGLEEISSGELRIGGQRINEKPPIERGVAMVFQGYALYPHMTVYQNMAFGLKVLKTEAASIDRKVREAARALQLDHLLGRLPKELSGGQRQRVAIGRAIVRQPRVFLFDEPLSNLDAELRVQTRLEIARLHADIGSSTMVYVTHDQVEAMTLGERIVVINGGRIEQVGTPFDLYNHPGNLFVAGFLGAPKMNFIAGEVAAAGASAVSVRLAGGALVEVAAGGAAARPGDPVTLGVRAEHMAVQADYSSNLIDVEVGHVEYLGDQTILYTALEAGAPAIAVKQAMDGAQLAPGSRIRLHLPAQRCHLFDSAGLAFPRTIAGLA